MFSVTPCNCSSSNKYICLVGNGIEGTEKTNSGFILLSAGIDKYSESITPKRWRITGLFRKRRLKTIWTLKKMPSCQTRHSTL